MVIVLLLSRYLIFFKAAGVIPVAHASGGPLKDIIRPVDGKPTGLSPFLHSFAMLTVLQDSMQPILMALLRRSRKSLHFLRSKILPFDAGEGTGLSKPFRSQSSKRIGIRVVGLTGYRQAVLHSTVSGDITVFATPPRLPPAQC